MENEKQILINNQGDRFTVDTFIDNTAKSKPHYEPLTLPDVSNSYDKFRREQIALDCLKAMLLNPSVMNQSFDVISDFAFRQADSFLAKAREPQI